MKKSLAILALLLLTGSSLSAAQKDPRSMLMKDMRTMLDAMEQIQRGGFYSSSEDMKLGVKKLQGTLGSLETEDVQWILPKDQKHAFAFAQKSAKMLRMYSDDLVVSVDSGRMDDALENYNQLLRQCMFSH
jgi:hypothetical protein